MVTARQIRAARALLGWSQHVLADKAVVSATALARLERGVVDTRLSTLSAVQAALESAGVEFQAVPGQWEGIRLIFGRRGERRRPDPARPNPARRV
jgi:transcriptional regulator with XRE-family HTH domain